MTNLVWKNSEKRLKKLVLDFFIEDEVKIFLFGSRARGDNQVTSDVDIGIIPNTKIDEKKITFLKEEIEKLNIPYKVEIINFAESAPDFRKEALKGAVIWRD